MLNKQRFSYLRLYLMFGLYWILVYSRCGLDMTSHRVCNKSNTTGVTCEQELHILPEHSSSPSYFKGVCVARYIVFRVVLCRSLYMYMFLSFFFWTLYCLSFDLRILITPFGIFKLFIKLILLYMTAFIHSNLLKIH